MTRENHLGIWIFGLTASASVVGALVVAGQVVMDIAQWRTLQTEIGNIEKRTAVLASPALRGSVIPLTTGSAANVRARTGELLNAQLTEAGLQVLSIDVRSRRALAPGIEAQQTTVRAQGSTQAGLKALAWIRSNPQAIAVESFDAYAAKDGLADWTMNLVVLTSVEPD